MTTCDECHAVLLTPAGRGAVASILIVGERATACVTKDFIPASGRPFKTIRPGEIVFGRWGLGEGRAEEVVMCRRLDGAIEVHCHGGRAVIQALMNSLSQRGCRVTEWKSWLRASARDPVQGDARVALSQARTSRVAMILYWQYEGALRACIDSILRRLGDGDLAGAVVELEAVLAWSDFGMHLTRPWHVVLVGPPNAGKSSLMNAIAGYRRAIVHGAPGTTRDAVRISTALEGWPVELTDTAGLRATRDRLEEAGVAQTRRQLRAADLIVLVLDASRMWVQAERELAASYPQAIQVFTKSDLPRQKPAHDGCLDTSAARGEGVDSLVKRMALRLVPRVPPPRAAVPFTVQQVQQLQESLAAARGGDAGAAAAHLRPLQMKPRAGGFSV